MANASHYEGFGMTLLEAMRYGTPCVISNIPVYHDVAGESAVYFDQKNPTDIAQKITTVLQNSDELQKRRVAAKAQAESFNWQAVASSLYEKIIQTLR